MKKHHLIEFTLIFLVSILLIVPTRAYSKNISPSDDAYVNSYLPDDNYGASDYLHIGTSIGYCVTFLKFEIPTTDRALISATISTHWYNFLCETWLTIKAGTTSNSWTEETITYNNCPYYYTDLLTTESITDGDYLNFDVTDYIPETGPFSIIIWEETPYTGDYLQGDSKEGELAPKPPRLSLTYESRIEDFLPAIIGGTVGGIIGIGVILGVIVHLRNKKKKERIELDTKKIEKVEVETATQIQYTFCPQCGSRLVKEAKFCTGCGAQL